MHLRERVWGKTLHTGRRTPRLLLFSRLSHCHSNEMSPSMRGSRFACLSLLSLDFKVIFVKCKSFICLSRRLSHLFSLSSCHIIAVHLVYMVFLWYGTSHFSSVLLLFPVFTFQEGGSIAYPVTCTAAELKRHALCCCYATEGQGAPVKNFSVMNCHIGSPLAFKNFWNRRLVLHVERKSAYFCTSCWVYPSTPVISKLIQMTGAKTV